MTRNGKIRVGAAVTAVVLALLILLTLFPATGPEAIVEPTGGVTHGGPQDALPGGGDAERALAARTALQEHRDSAVDERQAAAMAPAPLQGDAAAQGPPLRLVERWLAEQPADYMVLRERRRVDGISPTLPDPRAPVLVQGGGRDWRRLHNEEITFGGAWLILGAALLMAVFLAVRGRVRMHGEPTGRTVTRFNAFERGVHWFTAGAFVTLGLTGLVLLYGQALVKPWLGAGAYSALAQASLYTHVAFTLAFVAGVVVMAALWIRQNGLRWYDWQWLRRGGGIVVPLEDPPPAARFNAGEKLYFWFVLASTVLLLASGLILMFPFFWVGIDGMQWALIGHAALGLVTIALVLAHVYIGTVGMERAIDGMWSGEVDETWAKEHHSLWVIRDRARGEAAAVPEQERQAPEPTVGERRLARGAAE